MAKFGFSDLNSNLNPQDFSSGASSALNDLASKIVAARVKDIILDNQHPKFAKYGGWAGLGTIEYEIVGDQTGVTDKSPYALPLLPYLKNYPLVQEIVILFQLPNKDINENQARSIVDDNKKDNNVGNERQSIFGKVGQGIAEAKQGGSEATEG